MSTRTALLRPTILLAAIGAIALSMLYLISPIQAAENDNWFVCKYVGTPGVDERLQTGKNPISVSSSAIAVDPVVAGTFFADGQGRSYVLELDEGQPEPSVDECPPPGTLIPTPSPSVAESASEAESASGEQSVAALTFSAEQTQADSALFGAGSSPLPTIAFSLILLASLGGLAYANVKSVRSRI